MISKLEGLINVEVYEKIEFYMRRNIENYL